MCSARATDFTFFALIVMVLLFPIPSSTRTIADELKDFCSIIPNDRINKIAEEHIKTDKEFNEAIIYLQSDGWDSLVNKVRKNPEWMKLKTFLNSSGLNLDIMFDSLFEFVDDLIPSTNEVKTNRSLNSFFNDVDEILPVGKILTMLHEKKRNNTVFRKLYDKVSDHEVHHMFENVMRQADVRKVLVELKSMGFRIDEILDLFYGFMNWDAPARINKRNIKNHTLKDDFEDFKALIPWKELKNISDEHLANNNDLSEVVFYLQGPEFAKIIGSIRARVELELQNFMEENGFEMKEILQGLFGFILSAQPMVRAAEKENDETLVEKQKGFKAYMTEIEAALPVAELLKMFNDKMDHDDEFKIFFGKIRDHKVKKMVDDIRGLTEFKKLQKRLQSFGIEIQEALIIVYAFLGWGSPFSCGCSSAEMP